MSNLISAIETGSAIAGSQAALAMRLGVPASHVSGWKKGRPCSPRQRVLLAVEAKQDVGIAALEGMLDTAERTGDIALAEVLRKQLERKS